MAQVTRTTKSKRIERAIAVTCFVVAAVAFTVAFGVVFDSYAIGLGPGIAIAVAVFSTSLRKAWRKEA